jgi:hypothetical protein
MTGLVIETKSSSPFVNLRGAGHVRHILIPTDGSELAQKAVIHGLTLAKSVGAKVTALTVEASLNVYDVPSSERRTGAKGNTHQHNTYRTQSQARVTNALERIRPLSPSHTRGGSRMRESRLYGSVRGACDETHVPTATASGVHHADRRCGSSVAPCRTNAHLCVINCVVGVYRPEER